MADKKNNIQSNGSDLRDYALSVEKTARLIAIVVTVAATLAATIAYGLPGIVIGLLIGGSIGFAILILDNNTANAIRAIANVDDNIVALSNKIDNIDSNLEDMGSAIASDLKAELKNITPVVASAPVASKTAPTAEEKPAPIKKVEAPKAEEVKPVSEPAPVAAPVAEAEEEPEVVEPITPKKTFTPIPAPVKKEEPVSPFAAAPAPKATKAKADEPKKEAADTEANPSKKPSLYRCKVCGNMVNATPCPRCAMKAKKPETPAAAETEAPAEAKEEKSSIWAAATKPVSADELAPAKPRASSFKKTTDLVAEANEAEAEAEAAKAEAEAPKKEAGSPFARAVTPAAAPKAEEPKAEVKRTTSSPFASANSGAAAKVEAPKTEAAPAKKNTLYKCDVCGHMVNSTPCPRCAIKAKKNGGAAANNEDAAKKPEAPAAEEEAQEDVNPIWAAATKPDGSFGGSSGGGKLMGAGVSIAPTVTSSPLKAAETATTAPSWAKPSEAIQKAELESAANEEEAPASPFAKAEPVTVTRPAAKKPASNEPSRPIWEVAAEQKAAAVPEGGAKPGWMQ